MNKFTLLTFITLSGVLCSNNFIKKEINRQKAPKTPKSSGHENILARVSLTGTQQESSNPKTRSITNMLEEQKKNVEENSGFDEKNPVFQFQNSQIETKLFQTDSDNKESYYRKVVRKVNGVVVEESESYGDDQNNRMRNNFQAPKFVLPKDLMDIGKQFFGNKVQEEAPKRRTPVAIVYDENLNKVEFYSVQEYQEYQNNKKKLAEKKQNDLYEQHVKNRDANLYNKKPENQNIQAEYKIIVDGKVYKFATEKELAEFRENVVLGYANKNKGNDLLNQRKKELEEEELKRQKELNKIKEKKLLEIEKEKLIKMKKEAEELEKLKNKKVQIAFEEAEKKKREQLLKEEMLNFEEKRKREKEKRDKENELLELKRKTDEMERKKREFEEQKKREELRKKFDEEWNQKKKKAEAEAALKKEEERKEIQRKALEKLLAKPVANEIDKRPAPKQENVLDFVVKKSEEKQNLPSKPSDAKDEKVQSDLGLKKKGFGADIFQKPNISKVPEKIPLVHNKPENIVKPNETDLSTLTIENTTPIVIQWELGAIKELLERSNLATHYNLLLPIIEKANSILKMYFRVPKSDPLEVTLDSWSVSRSVKMDRNITYQAHLVLVGKVYQPTNADDTTIAWAGMRKKDKTTNRSTNGVFALNFNKMINKNSTPYEVRIYVDTLVHEVIHALGFASNSKEMWKSGNNQRDLKHIEKIKNHPNDVYKDGHWQSAYMPNDLMIPTSTAGNILTIFTLEVLEFYSKGYYANKKNLPYNIMFDEINDPSTLWNSKCNDSDETSKFPFFCSKKMALAKKSRCSADFTSMAMCSSKQESNGCHLLPPNRDYNCLIKETKDRRDYVYRGIDSRCFESEEESLCLKYKVEGDKVRVYTGANSYLCSRDGELIKAKHMENANDTAYYNIEFKCPKNIQQFILYSKKTSCPDNCNFNGFCNSGTCVCFEGWNEATNCRDKKSESHNGRFYSESSGIIAVKEDV